MRKDTEALIQKFIRHSSSDGASLLPVPAFLISRICDLLVACSLTVVTLLGA